MLTSSLYLKKLVFVIIILITTKINKHTPSVYSLCTHCSFDNTKNRHDYYRGQDCMKMFCKDLKEHATKTINYEKKRNDGINLSGKLVSSKSKSSLSMQKKVYY